MGTVYLAGCCGSALIVIPLALSNKSGIVPQVGFTVMALCWILFSWLGLVTARRKRFVEHRRWTMRSYALTFAFIHVNFTYLLLPIYGHLTIVWVKVMQSMVSWMANLLLVEIYLAATTFKGKFVGTTSFRKNLKRALH